MAPPLVASVASGGEVIISLPGLDASGRPLSTYILSTPAQGGGALFQLTTVYNTHAYEPARGVYINGVNAPVQVTGSRGRVVFAAPHATPPHGPWGNFSYVVSDGSIWSSPGTVVVTPLHKRLAWSEFLDGNEGWSITGNGAREAGRPGGGVLFEALSRGKHLNRYILGSDAEISTSISATAAAIAAAPPAVVDVAQWRFVASPCFTGSLVASLGGSLRFDVGSFAGDFSSGKLAVVAPLVTMECATCDGGAGIRLGVFVGNPAAPSVTMESRSRTVIVPMLPSSWLRDSKNSLAPWTQISTCDLAAVLSAVSRITILGDMTSQYETVAIDNVWIETSSTFVFPRQCLR